jgi:hypothetical protein
LIPEEGIGVLIGGLSIGNSKPLFTWLRRWKTHGVYQTVFARLLRDLKAEER